jgi:hypothetical protein
MVYYFIIFVTDKNNSLYNQYAVCHCPESLVRIKIGEIIARVYNHNAARHICNLLNQDLLYQTYYDQADVQKIMENLNV